MKCEKCACELSGSRVICPQCGFNNAAHRAAQWNARRQNSQTNEAASHETAPEPAALAAAPAPSANSSAAARVRARYSSEAKLLQFPITPKAELKAETETAKQPAPSEPAWRELARAKVRAHQQRRSDDVDGATPPPTPEDPTSQLIVESALKRIRRAQLPPTVRPMPRVPRNTGGQAVARALDYDEQPHEAPATTAPEDTVPETAPVLRTVPTSTKPNPQPQRQATPETLRARLESLTPNTAMAEAAPVHQPANSPVNLRDEASVALQPSAEVADEVVTPAQAVLEQAAADIRVTPSKKSNVWVGKPAPIWLRALAGAVDLEAAALAYLPFFGAYTSLDGLPEWGDFYLMASILAIVLFLYQLITYTFNGRTFGMALCGLRCVDLTDASTPISFQRRLWQSLGGTLGLLLSPFNYVVTRLTEHQRGLADALGQTITLRRAED